MHITALTSIRLVVGLIAIALLAVAAVAEPERAKPVAPLFPEAHDALREYVNDVQVGSEPLQVGRLTLVPLEHPQGGTLRYVQGHPSLLEASLAGVKGDGVVLRLRNDTSRAILATAGRIVYAQGAEYVLSSDVLVPAEGHRDVAALPSQPIEDGETKTAEDVTLRWYPRWAPTALSKKLAVRDDASALPRLLERHAANAEQPQLRDLLSSEAGRVLDPKLAKVLHEEAFRGPKVVGFVVGIDGRAVGLHLFGGAHLHRAKAAGLLGSFGLYAHALESRGEDLKIRTSEGERAKEAVASSARDLLASLQSKSRFIYGPGKEVTVKGPGITGFGSVHGGAPLHLTLKPGDPARKILFEADSGA